MAIMDGTLLIGVSPMLINNLTDLLVRLTDPRMRQCRLICFCAVYAAHLPSSAA